LVLVVLVMFEGWRNMERYTIHCLQIIGIRPEFCAFLGGWLYVRCEEDIIPVFPLIRPVSQIALPLVLPLSPSTNKKIKEQKLTLSHPPL